jgi:hypothetical protein
LPNFLNRHRCNYIKFGEREISQILTLSGKEYYAQSIYMQLQKADRKFTYHISFLSARQKLLSRLLNNSRAYVIHVNLSKEMSNFEIIEAYYFARKLDQELQ